jgi:hypothetical protein
MECAKSVLRTPTCVMAAGKNAIQGHASALRVCSEERERGDEAGHKLARSGMRALSRNGRTDVDALSAALSVRRHCNLTHHIARRRIIFLKRPRRDKMHMLSSVVEAGSRKAERQGRARPARIHAIPLMVTLAFIGTAAYRTNWAYHADVQCSISHGQECHECCRAFIINHLFMQSDKYHCVTDMQPSLVAPSIVSRRQTYSWIASMLHSCTGSEDLVLPSLTSPQAD